MFFKIENGTHIIAAIYVDDKMIFSKDLGEAHWILGIEIICNREKRTIELLQQRYVESILKCFNMQDARPVTMPMDPKCTGSNHVCDACNTPRPCICSGRIEQALCNTRRGTLECVKMHISLPAKNVKEATSLQGKQRLGDESARICRC